MRLEILISRKRLRKADHWGDRRVASGVEYSWSKRAGRSLLSIGISLFLLFAVAVPGSADDDPADEDPPLDPRFGLVETYHQPDAADNLGVSWSRLLFYWSELQPEGPDSWNEFHAPLAWIDREIEAGRTVVGLLKSTPDWATEGSAYVGVPEGLYLPVDDPDNLWATFVRDVVTRYEGKVQHWIVWNEPDISSDAYGYQWEGSPQDYYQLLKVTYLVAKEIDPQITIHLAAMTYWHDPDYLDQVLTAAEQDPTAPENGYYFDVASLHIYFRPETTLFIVEETREQLATHGLGDKAIWINETNAPPFDDPDQP
ncbi:MAG: hypothetical protein GYB68_05030, partial [Chloroflexi bacterium]|nr:hypothetical protein [Chloroflexota bacterium]